MPNSLLASELNSNGHKALDPQITESFQRRLDQNGMTGGVFSWYFRRADDGLTIAPYWSEMRDRQLRDFVRREGNDILQGAISSMVKWGKNLAWLVEGPQRVVNRYQETLSQSEFGEGWGLLVSKVLEDYFTQDKGATIEIIGGGRPDGPLQGPVLGLAHLDAQFVQPTGDPEFPILYNNMKDGKVTSSHKVHASRVIRLVDMPSPDERLCGVGFCAVSRVIAASEVLLKLARYKNEKLSDMPEAGLLVLNNILPRQWEDAQANHQRERRRTGSEIWSNIMTLHSIDPAQPAKAELVSFADIPEGFDELQSTNIYVSIVALSFGVDPREFWPMSQGRLGSAMESEVQAEKAKGKGRADIISTIERAINWKVLPGSVSFRFDFKNDEEDKLRAEINGSKVSSIMSMWDSESYRAGLPVPITALELRQMLADNVPDYFKPDFLEFDVTDEEELSDTERDEKSLGPRVALSDKGRVISHRYKNTDMVLATVEQNYKDGLIALDDLIEFRLGNLLDTQEDMKYNPHHGHDGRFTGPGGSGGKLTVVPDKRKVSQSTSSGGGRSFANLEEDTDKLSLLSGQHDSYLMNISDNQRKALDDYTGNDAFVEINGSLRGYEKPSKKTKQSISDIESAINNAPPIPFDMVTHRALLADLDLKPGQTFEDKGFVSTTISKKSMQDNFASSKGTVFTIKVPKGSKGLYVESISLGEDEKELLLPRGSKFKVDDVQTVNGQRRITLTLQ